MINDHLIKKMLFFDIETAGKYANYDSFVKADPKGADIIRKKFNRLKTITANPTIDELNHAYESTVSLYPEFGRIVCLSYGLFNDGMMVVNVIHNQNEEELVKNIHNLFLIASNKGYSPTGWNIKNFDVPWLCRKFLMYNLSIPEFLNIQGKKPWENSIIDLKEWWKCSSNLDVSFEEAIYSLGLPSPKNDIEGSQVHKNFWEGNYDRINNYCKKDVSSMIDFVNKVKTKESR